MAQGELHMARGLSPGIEADLGVGREARGGDSQWHVEKRSTVLICQNCEARIPLWKKPKYCPECGAGRPDHDG